MSELMVLDQSGDTRLQWDHRNHDQVEAAKKRFAELKKKGYASFRVNKNGSQGEQIDAFNPLDDRVVMLPPLVGG